MTRGSATTAAARTRIWHTSLAVTGTLAAGLSQWGVVAVMARTGGSVPVGTYALCLALTAPAYTLTMMQLRVLWVTEPDGGERFGVFLAVRLASSTVALLGLLLIGTVFSTATGAMLAPIATARFLESCGDLYQARLQRVDRLDLVGAVQCLGALSTLGTFWFTVRVADLTVALWSVAAASALTSLALPAAMANRSARCTGTPEGSAGWRRPMAGLVRHGFPLGTASMVTSLTVSVPRILVHATDGARAVGLLSAVTQVGQGISMFAGAVAQAILPETVRRYRRRGPRALLARTETAVGCCAALGGVLVLAAVTVGPAAVSTLYGGAFDADRAVLATLAVLTALSCTVWFLEHALTALRKSLDQLRVNLATLLLTAAGCAIAVPAAGVLGALLAATLGACFQVAVKLRLLRSATRVTP